MGDSILSPGKNDIITIESLARDLLSLLRTLKWREISLCGFSMGGTYYAGQFQVPFNSLPTFIQESFFSSCYSCRITRLTLLHFRSVQPTFCLPERFVRYCATRGLVYVLTPQRPTGHGPMKKKGK